MTPRRVMLLAGFYYPDSIGGTEAYVQSLATELQSLGHEVIVGAPSVDEQCASYVYEGVTVFRYPVEEAPSISEVRGLISPARFEVFEKWVHDWQPDVAHLHSVTRGCGVFHARHMKSIGVPVVITAHVPGVVCPRSTLMRWGRIVCDGEVRVRRCGACYLHSRGIPRGLAWPMAVLPPRIFEHIPAASLRLSAGLGTSALVSQHRKRTLELLELADRVVVVAAWLHAVLRRNGVPEDRLVLSRHGLGPAEVPTRAANHPADSGVLRLAYVGRFDPVKGVDILLKAFRRLPKERRVELHVFGVASTAEEREYRAYLELLAAKDPRVVFAGPLTRANRRETLESMDALAVPSVWLEAGPLVVLEAFAAGIPVIGSNVGGIAELVGEGVSGLLADPGDVEAWAQTIEAAWHRKTSGRWIWAIPNVRTVKAVALEMQRVYEEVGAAREWAGDAVL